MVVGHRGQRAVFPGQDWGSEFSPWRSPATPAVQHHGELPETAAAVTVGVDGSRPYQPAVEFNVLGVTPPCRCGPSMRVSPCPSPTPPTSPAGAAAQEAATEQLHEWVVSPWLERYPRVSTELKAEAGVRGWLHPRGGTCHSAFFRGSSWPRRIHPAPVGLGQCCVVRHAHRPVAGGP